MPDTRESSVQRIFVCVLYIDRRIGRQRWAEARLNSIIFAIKETFHEFEKYRVKNKSSAVEHIIYICCQYRNTLYYYWRFFHFDVGRLRHEFRFIKS